MPSSSSNPSTMATNGKESSPVPVNMPYLPDDLLLSCLARVSRMYYPTLSLVSKRFRSLLTSTDELYETRKLLGSTESCLYVVLSNLGSNRRWYTLSWKPTQIANPNNSRWSTPFFNPLRILTNRNRKESSGNFLVSVPAPNIGPPFQWIHSTVGSNIYIMFGGRYTNCEPSSRVFVINCLSHTWHEAPSMLVAKKDPLVTVLDGKIYVVERSSADCDLSNFIECFDPKTKIWEHVPSPGAEIRGTYINEIFALEGNLYLLFRNKKVVYKPKENKWDVVGINFKSFFRSTSTFSCVIDNIVYTWYPYRSSSRMIEWYDSGGIISRTVEGLKFPKSLKRDDDVRLVNCGGNLVVLWEENVRSINSTKKKMIRCAEIAIERRNKQEIRGKILWCDVVLTVPKSCHFEELLVATI